MTSDIYDIGVEEEFHIRETLLNPLGFHLLYRLEDQNIRLLILQGGSSSGKSYSVAQIFLILTYAYGDNHLVLRKVGASISKTIYEDFKCAAKQLGLYTEFIFTDSLKRIKCIFNGAKIDFAGLDDPEKIKGISNYKRVFMDEWSEFDEADYKQIRKRLRGKAGQQIVTAFNPIKETHWIKKNVIDLEEWHDCDKSVTLGGETLRPELTEVKNIRINSEKTMLNPRTKEIETHAPDTVLIQTTYLNNFWVVGSPDGKYGFYDEQCIADFEKDRIHDPDYYNIYALGEWGVIRTGSEFFSSFARAKHVGEVPYDPTLPIHVSVDSNVLPYITVTAWQVSCEKGTHLRQIFELLAESPNNTVRKSARLLAKKLKAIGNTLPIHLHGDASTKAANNIDEQKRSFHDLFISTLQGEGIEVIDKVGSKNPSVQMSGEFINAVLDGVLECLSVTFSEGCPKSIEDYLCVQKDENGAILKTRVKNKTTGQSYEEHGHISDTFRYVCTDVMQRQFTVYSNRRKRSAFAAGAIRFYNPDTQAQFSHRLLYVIPNIGGRFVMASGGKAGDSWWITDAAITDSGSSEAIKERLLATGCPVCVFECSSAYYPMVRELRASTDIDIRVIKESPDIDRRIAATADYVRSRIKFRDCDEEGYTAFLDNLLDYTRGGQSKEASAAISGFVMYAEKSFSD